MLVPVLGAMAQLVARLVRNEKVGGSNPPSSTTRAFQARSRSEHWQGSPGAPGEFPHVRGRGPDRRGAPPPGGSASLWGCLQC